MADRSDSSTSVNDHSEGNSEITLYKDNQPLLKAECGITLGLLKLIYSSDDTYHGVLLGVKPRLSNGTLPCVITFDSTQLTHAEYDLIVQGAPSAVHSQRKTSGGPQISTIPQRQFMSTEGSIASCSRESSLHPIVCSASTQETSDRTKNLPPSCSNLPKDLNSHDHQSSPNSTNQFVLADQPVIHEHRLLSQQEGPSSEKFLSVDCVSKEPPDSTVQEFEIGSFALNTSADKMMESHQTDLDAPAEILFNPEDFNFDIGSVIPFQSEKGMRWPCDRCGKDFCSSSHLKRHWILHTDFKPYKCKVCGKCFAFQWDLKKHLTKHTGNKPFKCPSCPKSFNTQKERRNHNWLHTGKKEYECHVCHGEFSSHGNLKIHMRKHTGEKPYKCEYCPKSFYMLGHYQYHVRGHTGEKPYTCDICGKTFSYSNNLNEHRNVHTGERPYSCSQCEKKFTHRSTFKQHVLMHQGNKPYKCHVCSKAFVQSSNYRRHVLTHKKKEDRVQKCDLCGKELLSSRGVQKHRLRCVKKTVERASANEVTVRKKTRLKRGEFPCERCPKIFSYSRRLEAHVSKKHPPSTEENKVKPSVVSTEEQEKTSELTWRKKSRGKRGEYHCEHCPKVFANSRSFEVHVIKTHSPSTEDGMVKPSGASGGPPNVAEVSRTLLNQPRRLLEFQCSECGRRFGYNKRLREHLIKVHHRVALQGDATTAEQVSQTRTSQTSTTSILPKSADMENDPSNARDLTGCPAGIAQEVIHSTSSPDNSQPTGNPATNKYLHPDEKDKQKADETGSEALCALSRLSAKIGMEGNISLQSLTAPGKFSL